MARACKRVWLACQVMVLVVGVVVQGETGAFSLRSAERPQRTFREMRYDGVVGQTSWYTCGLAALATLLTYYFEEPVDERDVVKMVRHRHPAASLQSVSMLDLKDTLSNLGFESRGYRISSEALRRYFARGGWPVLIHLSLPETHFALLVDATKRHTLVADPSFGMRIWPWGSLEKLYGFSGYALVPLPSPRELNRLRKAQRLGVRRFDGRGRSLRRLGGDLLW